MEKTKGKNEDDDLTSSMDRVSELPLPILHHILCFLPQDEAAQTLLLSKSWFNVWCTRPNIEFRQPLFAGNTKDFLLIMERTLKRYHRQNLSIKRFVVNMSHVYSMSRVDSESILLFEKWIPIVLMHLGVEIFHLTFHRPYSDPYYYFALPSAPVVFQAEFLTELYLSGFKINSTVDKLCLKRLNMLSLNKFYVEDEAFEKIMASCPLVKRLDLYKCKGLTTVKIKVPSALETIKITDCPSLCLYNINNHHFPRLKSLYLSKVELPKDFFDNFSSNYPCLEDFQLINCWGIKEVVILSSSVNHLIIVHTKRHLKTITIDAPHILYFEFSGSKPLPSVSFARVASREWESRISVPSLLERSNIDIKLKEVLKALKQSRITLNLDCIIYQHIKGINSAGCYEPLVVEHLNLKGFDSYGYDEEEAALFNCLFRSFHPRYVYTRMHLNPFTMRCLGIDKLAEFIWKTNLKDVEASRCYFWQQRLKKLTVEISNHDTSQWRLVQGSCLTVRALEEIQEKNNIRFGFEWSE